METSRSLIMNNNKGRGASYRQKRQAKAASEQTFEVTLPSGEVFTLCKVDIQIFAVSGALPLTLAEKMERLRAKGATNEEAFQALSVKEQAKSVEVTSKIVRKACVNPRIVDYPETDNEIAPEDLSLEDYLFIANFAQNGEVTEQLDSFRDERSNDAVDFLDIPEYAREGESIAQDS